VRVAPAEPVALRGCVLTPERRIDDGYVVLQGDEIGEVRATPPGGGMRVLDTDGVILPGLIDLHGHPEYNIFAAWEPPRAYRNRHQWRRSDEYATVVKEPWRVLTDDPEKPSLREELVRYAEARSLVGGVTAIQGANRTYVKKEEALVRNVDLRLFGRHVARSIVDLDRTETADRQRIRAQIDAGEVTALYVHLAEGVDDLSRREFDDLVDANLLTAATVIIHGTALDPPRLAKVREAGAKLVWSPQSNLRLYEQTTDAAGALDLEIPLALGADWLPSGSPSLLAEMSVARRSLRRQGHAIAAKRLVRMVTADAADIAGVGELLGRLEPGRPADILVLERNQEDPWESVVQADRWDVELVTIGGNLVYGRRDWLTDIAGGDGEIEPVLAWGKEMAMDTSYSVLATGSAPPRLADLRARLLERFSRTGPIFA
jgi:5-methylthioadenosine/S-adenosylhomocysteine deaminase